MLTRREKPHTRLRMLMDSYGVLGQDIANWIGHSDKYVSDRMLARHPWTIDEIYIIADKINGLDPENPPLPYVAIAEYFPLGGLRAKMKGV